MPRSNQLSYITEFLYYTSANDLLSTAFSCGGQGRTRTYNQWIWRPLQLPIVLLTHELGAGDEGRTRDIFVGNEVLYH